MPAETPSEIRSEREEGPTKGRYFVRLDGAEAELTYTRAGDGLIIIDHTGVPAAMRGMSVGQGMVRRAVEDARAENRGIVPLCPFARAQIARHPEWQDVLSR